MFAPSQIAHLFQDIKKDQQLWLGYSGGLDSHVLLFGLVELINAQQIPLLRSQLHAIHINHGWSTHASAWDKHCEQVCRTLNIDYHSINIDAKAPAGESPEAYARTARYQTLANVLNENDILLTAHHQDDQAETLLSQLLRGAGIKGLASMPQSAQFAKGQQLRPLLNISRDDLLAYAREKQLHWIEDESNANTRYTRNFLRHNVLPELKQRWPNVNATIARSASHCAEAALLVDELAQQDLQQITGEYPNTLSCSSLLALAEHRQKNVLRFWLNQFAIGLPSTTQLQRILQDVLHCSPDANPEIVLQDKILRRYQDNLFIINAVNLHGPNIIYDWDLINPLRIAGVGVLTAKPAIGQGIRADILQQGKLTIRFRQSGERCHPAGRQGSHPLKKLLQEWRVPPWLRDRVPLLYCDEQLVAVVGYCICEKFVANSNTEGFIIDNNKHKLNY